MENNVEKNIEIFDTHSHINSELLRDKLPEIIENAKEYGVRYIACPGYDMESNYKAVEIAEKYDEVYSLVGIHPDQVNKMMQEAEENGVSFEEVADMWISEVEKLALKTNKNVAIGEIGLDYYWEKEEENQKNQKILLKKQIELANKLDLPIALHTREATLDMIDMLKENKCNNTGIMHCCPLNGHLIKETLKLGYYISFAGVITFKNVKNAEECINLVPKDRILVETDAPYLTPEPNRGKENSPFNTYYVVEKIAEHRGETIEEIAKITTENAKRVYKIVK